MAEQQWYVARGGHQIGPVAESEIQSMIRSGSIDGNTHLFTASMTEWTHLRDVPQLAGALDGSHPDPLSTPPGRTAHEIDFKIEGTEMQYVEVELDPGESAVAEAGAMMYMTNSIQIGDDFR